MIEWVWYIDNRKRRLSQTGTSIIFQDDAGDYLFLETDKRWSLRSGQVVTVVKLWLPYVSNGKTGLHGWYLVFTGHGKWNLQGGLFRTKGFMVA